MRKQLFKVAALLAMTFTCCAAWADKDPELAVTPLAIDTLPSLHIPRSGHAVFMAGGIPMVVGGHTSGFVPTATAEYFSNGEWHLLNTVYPHDECIAVPLSNGQVLIGGGHREPLGIGHIFSVERYDTASHTFRGFGCLDHGRVFASATEIDSGRVVITGNWYQSPDDIELFDGQKYFNHVKPVAQPRAVPYVLPVADDDVIIFSSIDHHAEAYDTIWVDRLKGEPFTVPLFSEWHTLRNLCATISTDCFVGDREAGRYVYLLPVENHLGQKAICHLEDTVFTLLPTTDTIPTLYQKDLIDWQPPFVANRQTRRAFLIGYGPVSKRLYVLGVDYAEQPARLTFYATEPQRYVFYGHPLLMPSGDIMLAGGTDLNVDGSVDNFTPHNKVLLLRLGSNNDAATDTAAAKSGSQWGWWLLALAILLLPTIVWAMKRRKPKPATPIDDSQQGFKALMERICQHMESELPYLHSDLKLQDVADALNSNRTYISDCIKAERGMTFPQFVNAYRVEHAKQLLSNRPDIKISSVGPESGFSSDASFFRAFKSVTGMSPSEWRESGQRVG